MARQSYAVTIGQALGPEKFNTSVAGTSDAVTSTAAVDTTAVAAAIAVLVADGATPTQAHVTTLNSAWTTLLAEITAAKAAGTGDVVLSVDLSTITTGNQLRYALRTLLLQWQGNGSISH